MLSNKSAIATSYDGKDYNLEIDRVLEISEEDFCHLYLYNIYDRILKYCYKKSVNIKNFDSSILYNNFLNTEQNIGFFELLINAILKKAKTILRYDKKTNTIEKIKFEEYNEVTDCYLDFSNYKVMNLLNEYARLMYKSLNAIGVKSNVNNAIILKVHKLTDNVGLNAKSEIEEQGRAIKNALVNGSGAMIDALSSVEVLESKTSSEQEIVADLEKQISLLLGLPIFFLFGNQRSGLWESNTEIFKIENGMEPLFLTLWKPYFNKLFSQDIRYKIELWENIEKSKELISFIELVNIPPFIKQSLTSKILLDCSLITEEEAEIVANYVVDDSKQLDEDEEEQDDKTINKKKVNKIRGRKNGK
jgi:hypothetical protein